MLFLICLKLRCLCLCLVVFLICVCVFISELFLLCLDWESYLRIVYFTPAKASNLYLDWVALFCLYIVFCILYIVFLYWVLYLVFVWPDPLAKAPHLCLDWVAQPFIAFGSRFQFRLRFFILLFFSFYKYIMILFLK